MKFVLMIFIVAISGFVGNFFASKYVVRDKFFTDVIHLFNYIKNSINFKRQKLNDIIYEYQKNNENNKFMKLISSFVSGGSVVKIEDLNELYFLTQDEKVNFVRFLNELGTADQVVENQNINNFIAIIESYKKDAEDKRRKNEGAIYKLSLAAGCAVCILII